jgi:hypothetical protein
LLIFAAKDQLSWFRHHSHVLCLDQYRRTDFLERSSPVDGGYIARQPPWAAGMTPPHNIANIGLRLTLPQPINR